MYVLFRLPCGWIGFKAKETKANHSFMGKPEHRETLFLHLKTDHNVFLPYAFSYLRKLKRSVCISTEMEIFL